MKTITKEEVFQKLKDNMPYLRQRYGLERIALFGSVSKGIASEKSDLDFLVELREPLGFEFISLSDDLQRMFNRKIDLLTRYGLKSIPHEKIKESITQSLEYVDSK